VDRVQREALHRDLARLADGDRDAFHPVFVRLWPLLRGFAGRHLPREDADDVAQEALVKVFARVSAFDTGRDALSWVLGVAAWEIRTARRRRHRRREELLPAGLDRTDGGASPEETAMERERDALVDDALAALGPADAATLREFLAGGRPDVAGATFRKRVQRALARLRAAWRMSHGRP
jgi:RNA polymerase sigma-70 factor (ECF subfamily)